MLYHASTKNGTAGVVTRPIRSSFSIPSCNKLHIQHKCVPCQRKQTHERSHGILRGHLKHNCNFLLCSRAKGFPRRVTLRLSTGRDHLMSGTTTLHIRRRCSLLRTHLPSSPTLRNKHPDHKVNPYVRLL